MYSVISTIICSLLLFGWYLANYSVFYREFSDDIDVKHGRRILQRYYKSHKVGIFRKFILWDFRKSINVINYCLFWINMISFVVMLIGMIIQLVFYHYLGDRLMLYAAITAIISSAIPQLSSRSRYLYGANKVKRRNREKFK